MSHPRRTNPAEALLALPALTLPASGSRQLLNSLHNQLCDAILKGRLHPGLRLPSTRDLARHHGISRNTVLAAYDRLAAEGYIKSRPGGGSFVADFGQEAPASTHRQRHARPAECRPQAHETLSPYWRQASLPAAFPSGGAVDIDLSVGLPDKASFAFDVWRKLSARALRTLSKAPAAYAEAQGRDALRRAIAGHVSFTRAVACTAEDILVCNGAQQGFDLLARVLVTPGKTVVAVEDPGYPPLQRAFAAAGAVLVPVPVDSEGLCVDRLPKSVRVICVTPSHQFPLGMPLSNARRRALLAFARQHDAVIVEDDYDGEFRHSGRPRDALQTLDQDERVFYVGTFSKSLFPALRLGYVVMPPWARAALVAAKRVTDWHTGLLQQDTLTDFMREGHLTRHVRRMRRIYAERRDAALQAIRQHFGDRLEVLPSEAGLHLACLWHGPGAASDLVDRAAAQGIRLMSLDRFPVQARALNGLLLGLGREEGHRITQGLARLARASK